MGILTPDVSILPASQQSVWDQLRPTPEDFVLYGGTALALRLGHRQSVDFDFFCRQSFQSADLFGTTCATVPQRNEIKDYLDIHALITRAHMALSEGIACAGAIYGRQYNPLLTLQALSYFDDLPELLSHQVVSELLAAVKGTLPDELPTITASDGIGTHGRAE